MSTTPIQQVTYTWTGPPGIVWIRRPPFLLLIFMLVLEMALGFVAGMATFAPGLSRRTVPEFSAEEKKAGFLRQETFPTVIRLRIVPRDQFARERPNQHAIAFSWPTLDPCEIVIPAGWPIEVIPGKGFARFGNVSDGNTLAHEMLHCLRGFWHPEWSDIKEVGR